MSASEAEHLLYHDCGLLGVSGISADMRTLLASSERAAAEAVDLFAFRAAQQIAMMATTLGGLECLVFTGGIGEHSGKVREQICDRLRWLGVRLDPEANDRASERIGGSESTVDILIVPTNEELVIARHCAAVIRRAPR